MRTVQKIERKEPLRIARILFRKVRVHSGMLRKACRRMMMNSAGMMRIRSMKRRRRNKKEKRLTGSRARIMMNWLVELKGMEELFSQHILIIMTNCRRKMMIVTVI
jgi:hypothetical protein